MANILGIPNPSQGQNTNNVTSNQPVSAGDPKIQNAPDPHRVTGGDNRSEQQNAGDGEGMRKLQFHSNFGTFFQKLHESKDLSETLGSQLLRFTTTGQGGAVAAELAQIMQMLKMDEGELLKFINDQMASGNRFSGALFNALREAFAGPNTEGVKTDILQFLKNYSDFTSTDHVETNLLRTMDKLTRAIPMSFGNKLATMTGELSELLGREDGREGNRGEALNLLRGKIIPFLGDYTKKTHDMGLSRALISVLTYNTARLEGGSEEALLASFHQLNTHGVLHSKLGGLTDDALLKLIRSSGFMTSNSQNEFANHLIEASAEAMTGDSGSELQEVFKEVVNTYLINESVFMPLNHLTIPLDWFGKFMFSQLWIDPDAEENLKNGRTDRDPVAKVLIKMDIEDVGLFDLIVATQKDNAELVVNCPESVAEHANIVKKELGLILQENGFSPQSVHVGQMEKPLSLATVFPKIYEREKSVDVKA